MPTDKLHITSASQNNARHCEALRSNPGTTCGGLEHNSNSAFRPGLLHAQSSIRNDASFLILPIVLLLLCFSSIAFAQSAPELYKSAAQLYKTNQFDQAAADYEKILSQGYKTAEVYYNLGNCYYKLNTLNKAIVNYERALKLAPQDEDIIHNLAVANTKVVDKIQPVPTLAILNMWNNLIDAKSSHGWALVGVGFIWLALLFFAIYLFVGLRRFSFAAGILLVILSFTFVFLAAKQSNKEQQSDAAILMVSNSFVKSAPDANGNDLFMLHEGVKFQILDRVGEWSKIRLADGKVGWIERGNYEKI